MQSQVVHVLLALSGRENYEMTIRRLTLACALVLLAIAIPLAYRMVSRAQRLDRFLELRALTLTELQEKAVYLPAGIEHKMPTDNRRRHALLKAELAHLADHITSVVGRGEWIGDNWASHELSLSDEVASMPAGDITMMLANHYSNGLESLGLRSSQHGGPNGSFGERAMHSKSWRDPDNQLIVSLSVVVDRDSHSVHLNHFVHERFQ